MGQEGYVIAMNSTEDHTGRDSFTEAITKYAERATQAESRMSQMEANFQDKLLMMKM